MSGNEHGLAVSHGTTILSVRKNGRVVIAGDGQVDRQDGDQAERAKVRGLGEGGNVIGGFAGATADAFTLFERLERKLEQHHGQLMRAAVELAKDWRTDKYLRNLEAMMIVADKDVSLILTGNGDVLEPDARHRGDRLRRELCSREPPARWPNMSPTPRRLRASAMAVAGGHLRLHQ